MDLSMFSGFCGSSAAAEGLFTCRGLAALIFAFARGKATVPLGIAADIRQQLACYNDSLGLRSGGRQLLGFGRCFLSERHCVFSLVARLCHRRRLFIKQTTCMRCRPLASDCATAVRPQGSASYIAAVPACKEPGRLYPWHRTDIDIHPSIYVCSVGPIVAFVFWLGGEKAVETISAVAWKKLSKRARLWRGKIIKIVVHERGACTLTPRRRQR